MSVSANMVRLREAAGQSHEDVAAATRIQLNVVFGMEMGRTTQGYQIAAIAQHFGVSVEELEA